MRDKLEAAAQAIFAEIAHGDAEHREWLLNALRNSNALAAILKAKEQATNQENRHG